MIIGCHAIKWGSYRGTPLDALGDFQRGPEMLKFEPRWRFKPPPDGQYKNAVIPREALRDFDALIGKVATQGKRWDILEHFKGAFCKACGASHTWSSSESWADSDLSSSMGHAAENAPVFLDAFYDACQELLEQELFAPDAAMINEICEKHCIGYVLAPPDLLLRESVKAASVQVVERPPTVAESAMDLLQKSLQRAERLLSEGHHREAVQETLWVLESVTTAFRGVESAGDMVRGTYFNEIVKDLRRIAKGSTLERVLEWVTNVHGYLSSPTGGGVRHGLDLNAGVPIGANEARLFCNLIRSYISYLLNEHEQRHS